MLAGSVITMQDIFDQIRRALQVNLYYIGLFSALAVPDICGALEASDGAATKARYTAWFDRHVAPKYSSGGRTTLTGEDAYYFRCSMLHQARAQHPRSTYSRILFVEPSGLVFHNNVLNDALNIDVRVFVNDIVEAAENWLAQAGGNQIVADNLAASVRRHPNGLAPTFSGFR